MATKSRDGEDHPSGVEFIREDDGTITARDLETGVERGGDTRAEALTQLAEVLTLQEGGGEPVSEDDLEEMGLDPEDIPEETRELPEFLR